MLGSIQPSNSAISVLYDSQCPLCRIGTASYEPEGGREGWDLIDARQNSELKSEAIAEGYNLDKGMIIKADGRLLYGGEALHFMAQRADRKKWFSWQMYRIFRSRSVSLLLYPLLCALRSSLLWLRSVPQIHEADEGRKESTIRKMMVSDWNKLHPNVQRRFAADPAFNEHIFYRGVMETVECSLAGKLFAYLTRPIANPLTPHEGKQVRMDVTLYRRAGLSGVYWRRTYYYQGRTPYTVTSVKRKDSQGRLTECVGGGFGMVLEVKNDSGRLHFRSTRYFWQLGKFYIKLPHWLTPGETNVIHEDMNDGTFRFTISMDHACLGRTFYQTGIFREE